MAGAAGGGWKRAAAWLAMAAAMAGPSGAVGQGTGSGQFGAAQVQIPGQKRVTPLPNRMTGQSACPGYTVDNYMSQYNQRRATEATAAHCALAQADYAAYLKAIGSGEPQAKIDEAYAKHVRDSQRALDFAAGTPKPAPAPVGETAKAPAAPTGPDGYDAKCDPQGPEKMTTLAPTARTPKTASDDVWAAIDKHLAKACGGRPPVSRRRDCKVISKLFGDYDCKVWYRCAETAPSCTPTPR